MMPVEEFNSKSLHLYITRLKHFLFMTSHGMCKFGLFWPIRAFLSPSFTPDLHFPYPICAFTPSPLFLLFLATPFIYQHYKHFHTLYFFPSFLHLSYSMTLQVNTALILLSKTNHALLMCAVVAANQH